MDSFIGPSIVLAYFIGSIPSGVLLARLFGATDPRQSGSGNIGASNMARLGGKKLGILTFLADFLKGLLPCLAAHFVFVENPWTASFIGIAAVLGHCYSIFLRGNGGKGVSTTAGVFAVIAPIPLAAALAIWIITFLSQKITSLAAATSMLALLTGTVLLAKDWTIVIAAVTCVFVVIRRHEANWEALLEDQERKF